VTYITDCDTQPLLAPRVLSPEQRYVLKNLVERADDVRGEALFALGYWAGCRVSDVAHLRRENVHLKARSGWIKVGYKGNKMRSIDLSRAAREALAAWLETAPDSPYVFTSQRGQRLSEAGIHHWLRTLKGQARRAEWELIADVSFHDLRHDFAHRARAAGWSLEEIAYLYNAILIEMSHADDEKYRLPVVIGSWTTTIWLLKSRTWTRF
jgi:integrase